VLVLLGAVLAARALAAAGDLDQNFANGGKKTVAFSNDGGFDDAHAVAIQPDRASTVNSNEQRIVVAGSSAQGATGRDFAVTRLLPGGGVDKSFSGDGRRIFGFANGAGDDIANGVAIQPDGKIVVAGVTYDGGTGEQDFAVARLNPKGSLDRTFSGDGRKTFDFVNPGQDEAASAIALQGDGKVVVAGTWSPLREFVVARLNPNGSFDHTFGDGHGKARVSFNGSSSDIATAVAISPADGKIVVAGQSDQSGAGRGQDFAVARFKPDGGFDHTFSGDGRKTFGFEYFFADDGANGVAVGRAAGGLKAGLIYLAGYSFQGGKGQQFAIARLKPGGGFDTTFSDDGKSTFGFANGSGDDVAHGLAIQPDSKSVLVGRSSQGGASGDDFAIARLVGSGHRDPSFSNDGRRTFGFANGSDIAFGAAIRRYTGHPSEWDIVAAGQSYQGVARGDDFAVASLLGF
jgi:uncharacterized delta-60 repeat protein